MTIRPVCPKCDQHVPCICPTQYRPVEEAGFPEAFGAAVAARVKKMKGEGPSVVMSARQPNMSMVADYFGIDGPSCAEVAASIRKAHEEQAPFVGFVHHQLDPKVIAVPTRTIEEWQHRIEELRMEIARHGLNLTAVISHPDGQEAKAWGHPVFGSPLGEFRRGHLITKPLITPEMHLQASLCEQELRSLLEELDTGQAFPPVQHIKWTPPSADFVMTELEDPDSMLNQGLADALDARELDVNVCYPYLREDVHIESCPIVGKGIIHNCKHLIGRLDYCDQCEHEHDEPIDLSGMTI
ncbi:hypothetical protein [Aeromonas phage 85AhydR10PP]|nr:hypothetical protein [Aeromonas phage 85AhydR10PP]